MTKISDYEKTKHSVKMKLKLAAVILNAMADSETSLDQMDIRLNRKTGMSRKYLISLIDNSTDHLNELQNLATAVDLEIKWDITPN